MRHDPKQFDFSSDTILSLTQIINQVQEDADFPMNRRSGTLSSLRKFAQWVGQDPTAIPFVPPVLASLFAGLSPAVLGVSKKRLQNARADVHFVLDRYDLGGTRQYMAPFTPAVKVLWDMLETKYQRCSLSRLLHYLSAREINPGQINDKDAKAFLVALERESLIKDPRTTHKNAIRAWNKVVKGCPAWPQLLLSEPCYMQIWGRRWDELPASLETAVDAFLAQGDTSASLFDENAPVAPLKPSTIATQKDHLRCAASALVCCGIPAKDLVDLRNLCTPERFKMAIMRMVERRGGDVNSYLGQIAWTLTKTARYAGVLDPSDISEINRNYRKLSVRMKADNSKRTNRDQELLALYDDERVMDALLSLPALTVERILKSGEASIRATLTIQKALALEIWLCAPLRIENLVELRLDEHIFRATLNGAERMVIRVPGEDVKNKQPLEHFLHEDAAALLKLYVEEFRPVLVSGLSTWLFPGQNGNHKGAATLRRQMNAFVLEGTGVKFHPHLIRKIVTKLYLDADPGGIEIARRCLGHRDCRTTRAVYIQQQQRSAQRRYLEVLESRRLVAMRVGPSSKVVTS